MKGSPIFDDYTVVGIASSKNTVGNLVSVQIAAFLEEFIIPETKVNEESKPSDQGVHSGSDDDNTYMPNQEGKGSNSISQPLLDKKSKQICWKNDQI